MYKVKVSRHGKYCFDMKGKGEARRFSGKYHILVCVHQVES